MPNKPKINLRRLQELMDKKNFGLGELATYSGVKYQTMYSIKAGRRTNTTAETLTKIATALDTNVDYLLGESEDAAPTKSMTDPIRQLAEIATDLSQARQEELIRIAATLLQLEREQGPQPLPAESMRMIVELIEKLEEEEDEGDLLQTLKRMLRTPPVEGSLPSDNQNGDQPEQGD